MACPLACVLQSSARMHTLILACLAVSSAPVSTDVVAEEAAPEERDFNYGRAALEMGTAMALGIVWYETQIEVNKLDFDFDRTPSEQWRRLTSGDGYRFDDNARYLNVGHPFMGAAYHQFARVNGGSLLQSFLFSLGTSTLWELAVEHREVMSLNDSLMTPVGGLPIGESLFQLGELFARGAPTVRNRALMALASPAHGLSTLYGDGRPQAGMLDADGLPADRFRQLQLVAGGVYDPSAPGLLGQARLDSEIVSIPGYGAAGHSERRLRGGEATRLTIDYVGTDDDLDRFTLFAQSSVVGRHRQRGGHGTLVAGSSAFDLSYADQCAFTDFLAAAHLLGPTGELSLYRGPLWLRAGADLFGDFAMVRPYALDPAGAREVLAGTKSVLRRQHYYYALGVTSAARLDARYGRARAGASVRFNAFDSIEGLDRHQQAYVSPTGVPHAAISDDSSLSDTRLQLRLFAEAPVPGTDFKLGVGMDHWRRSGAMNGAQRSGESTRLSLLMAYEL